MCIIFIAAFANLKIVIKWIYFKNIFKYNRYLPIFAFMFNVLIRNNEQFDQNLLHITFFDIFFEEMEEAKVELFIDWFFLTVIPFSEKHKQ